MATFRALRRKTVRATIVLEKIDAAGRPVRQIELCDRHAEAMIARERRRGFKTLTAAFGANDIGQRRDKRS